MRDLVEARPELFLALFCLHMNVNMANLTDYSYDLLTNYVLLLILAVYNLFYFELTPISFSFFCFFCHCSRLLPVHQRHYSAAQLP